MIDSAPGTELTTAELAGTAPRGNPAKVTGRRRRFVDYYLINLNGAKSAELAGYAAGKSARTQATRLLADEDVSAAIAVGMTERAKRTEVTQDRVVRELARIAFADLRGLVRWGSYDRPPKGPEAPPETGPAGGELVPQPHALRNGSAGEEDTQEARIAGEFLDIVQLVPSDLLDPDDAAAVAEVGAGPNGLRIKLHDKQKALELLGRHLGMWNDPNAPGGPASAPIPPAINIVLVDARGVKP